MQPVVWDGDQTALEQAPRKGTEWFPPAPSQLWWDDDVGFEPNYTPGQLAGRPMSGRFPTSTCSTRAVIMGKRTSTWPETGHKPGRTLKLRQTQLCFGNVLSRIMLRPGVCSTEEGTSWSVCQSVAVTPPRCCCAIPEWVSGAFFSMPLPSLPPSLNVFVYFSSLRIPLSPVFVLQTASS